MESGSSASLPARILLLFMAVGLAVLAPFFYYGNPPGQDLQTQLSTWMEVSRQWREGTLFPRWAAQANYGFGDLRFIFYPPASEMLGAGLSLLLPWKLVPGAFVWLTLTLAGLTMFRLAREWLPPPAAAMAAVLYAANPYHLLMIYARSSFAELLAGAIFPLFLLKVIELRDRSWRGVMPLALLFAALWITDVPAAVLFTYCLALLLVFFAAVRKSAAFLPAGVAAMALGLALDAFYVLPAAVEQKWFNLGLLMYTWQHPEQCFLFVRPRDPFMEDVNLVGSLEIGLTAIGIVLSRAVRRSLPQVWWALVVLALCSAALMLPVSSIVWPLLPKLEVVQFAWRWLLVLGAPLAIFLAAGLGRLPPRAAWSSVAAVLLLGVGGAFVQQERETMGGLYSVNLEGLRSAIEGGIGYEEIDYNPRGYDSSGAMRPTPRVAVWKTTEGDTSPAPEIRIHSWKAESRLFTVDTPRPVTLAVRLFDYPAWRMEVNGAALTARSRTPAGHTLISVPAGHSEVRLTFTRTADRIVGGAISVTAVMFVLVLFFAPRRRPPRRAALSALDDPCGRA